MGTRPQSSPTRRPGETEKWRWPSGRIWLWILGLLALNYFLGKYFFPGPEAAVKIPYTVFRAEVEKGNVQEIFATGLSITGKFEEVVVIPPPAGPRGDSADVRTKRKPVEARNFTT